MNRLEAWWGRTREARLREGRSAAQMEALLRDIGPVEEMVAEIRAALVGRRFNGRIGEKMTLDETIAGLKLQVETTRSAH